jgi:hypothetical protein
MNQKTYKVWKYLLTYPNQWLSVYTISSELRLTFRQVISVLSGINSEYILKEHTGEGVEVCLDADEETLALLKSNAVRDYFDIDDGFINLIYTVLPPCGWISITDIAEDTGLKPIKISAALSTMTNVQHKCVGSMQMYSKKVA